MFTRKRIFAVLAAAGLMAGLALPLAGEAHTDIGIALNFGPPPPYYEYVPAPRVGYVWVPGYWDWVGRRHVWVAGGWVHQRPGYIYYPSRWEHREGRWYLERGRWDRDHERHEGRGYRH